VAGTGRRVGIEAGERDVDDLRVRGQDGDIGHEAVGQPPARGPARAGAVVVVRHLSPEPAIVQGKLNPPVGGASPNPGGRRGLVDGEGRDATAGQCAADGRPAPAAIRRAPDVGCPRDQVRSVDGINSLRRVETGRLVRDPAEAGQAAGDAGPARPGVGGLQGEEVDVLAVDGVRIGRIDEGGAGVAAARERRPARRAGVLDLAVVLGATVARRGRRRVQADAHELGDGHPDVFLGPGVATIRGLEHAAIVTDVQRIRVAWLEGNAVLVGVDGDGAGADVAPGGAAVGAAVQGHLAQVDSVGVVGLDGQDVVVPALAVAALGRVRHFAPGVAAVGGLVHGVGRRLEAGVKGVGRRGGHGQGDPAEGGVAVDPFAGLEEGIAVRINV